MDRAMLNKYGRRIGLCFWLILILIYFLFSISLSNVSLILSLAISIVMASMLGLVIFLHIKYLIPYFENKRWGIYIPFTVLLLVFFTSVDLLIDYLLYGIDDHVVSTIFYSIASAFFYALLIATSSILYFQGQAMIKSIENQVALRNEKLTSELNFLRAQINPHFLFNTLNNIYFYASSQHPATPDMIAKLSEILRYIVYDCKKDKVDLEKEIANMENLLNLYRMKNTKQKAITFEKPTFLGGLQIAPLILINLIENAFKHGDALSNTNGFISIKAAIDERDNLHFQVANSIKQKQVVNREKGIGQLNIKKQLELIYGEYYTLDTVLKDNLFNLNLTIQLDRKDI